MEFLKSSQLELNPAGYLISTETKKPVYLGSFIQQQLSAEYIIRMAEAVKGKTFVAGKLDNLDAIRNQVKNEMFAQQTKNYVATPKQPQSKLNDELVEYALNFAKFQESVDATSKINTFMNQFNKIDDVEQVGDYFEEGLVKLTKIYTIKEILAAVKTNIDILA